MRSHEKFDWNTEDGEAIEAATEDAKTLGLASLPDLVDQNPASLEVANSLLEKAFTELLHGRPSAVGVIAEQNRTNWFFLQPSDHIFDGAEVVEVRPVKATSGANSSDRAVTDLDAWQIIQKQPLLLRSLHGAIVGFKQGKLGIECVVVFEGEDGWT